MCGSTTMQNNLAQSESNFYSQMTNQYQQEFGQNQAIMQELQSSLLPTVEAGPNQMGFSSQELADLNSTAVTGAANAYNQESQALNEGEAAKGGNEFVPSGAQEALQGQLTSSAENNLSNNILGIQQAGYDQGNKNYNAAIGALSGVPKAIEDPLSGLARSTTGASDSANTEANAVQQANDSWMGAVGGLLGNAAGDFSFTGTV